MERGKYEGEGERVNASTPRLIGRRRLTSSRRTLTPYFPLFCSLAVSHSLSIPKPRDANWSRAYSGTNVSQFFLFFNFNFSFLKLLGNFSSSPHCFLLLSQISLSNFSINATIFHRDLILCTFFVLATIFSFNFSLIVKNNSLVCLDCTSP